MAKRLKQQGPKPAPGFGDMTGASDHGGGTGGIIGGGLKGGPTGDSTGSTAGATSKTDIAENPPADPDLDSSGGEVRPRGDSAGTRRGGHKGANAAPLKETG